LGRRLMGTTLMFLPAMPHLAAACARFILSSLSKLITEI
jgi:hypothetical protein